LAATHSGTTPLASPKSAAFSSSLTHAGMGRSGGAGDLHKLSSLEFIHCIPDGPSLLLINLDIGRS
jgi:hypothetical protein